MKVLIPMSLCTYKTEILLLTGTRYRILEWLLNAIVNGHQISTRLGGSHTTVMKMEQNRNML